MKTMNKTRFLLSICLALVFCIAPVQASSQGFQTPDIKSPDQPLGANGDGYADLAIGIPNRDYGTTNGAGMVGVVYGANDGLDYDTGLTFDQDTSGISGSPELNDHFGQALAGGDFNGDGYLDLAIGVPDEAIGTITNAGIVTILYGSSSGVSGAGSQNWDQSNLGTSTVETGDRFGAALASGDFNRDGYDDLAIGVPGQDLLGTESAGVVDVIYGASSGLTSNNWDAVAQGAGIQESWEEADIFGSVLTTGDFDGDGFHDLAIGVPMEDVTVGTDTFSDAGVVQIVYGSSAGISIDGDDLLYQGHDGLQDTPADYDKFGKSLAAGDFDGDGHDDLAIGVPNDDHSGTDAGIVQIVWGTFSGITTDVNMRIWQGLFTGQTSTADELFGWALAAGDFNGNGHDDLAIGVPGQAVTLGLPNSKAGTVHVFYGPFSSYNVFTKNNPNPHDDDQYGYSLAAGDIDGNGYDDLVVGVPLYDYSSGVITSSGALYTIYSDATGPDASSIEFGSIHWVDDSLTPELNDQFGFALVVLDEPHWEVKPLYLPVVCKN